MKAVTAEQMRALDRRTIDEAGIPGEMLMEKAGAGVAQAVRRLLAETGRVPGRVRLFAGRGNNGGDVFVAARRLLEAGCDVGVATTSRVQDFTGDARTHVQRLIEAGLAPRECTEADAWRQPDILEQDADVVVDGLLGTGIQGAARGPAAAAIDAVNALGRRARVVAVDIPSGLDADSGAAPGATVAADVTVTMGLPKRGCLEPCAVDYVGVLEVVDIGIPRSFVEAVPADLELITPPDIRPCLPRRKRSAHKGTFGHVLLVGGAPGYAGAVVLAARAALRSGVGLVSALVPEPVAPVVAAQVPEAMIHPGRATPDGRLAPRALDA
ncbi:MAG: NAD(P)H-hydrate epimerase, partial [Lentisphaerae bacterium]|nr:NAD(P)H-hydrate epimerase [Lentisphaerota bacterium]